MFRLQKSIKHTDANEYIITRRSTAGSYAVTLHSCRCADVTALVWKDIVFSGLSVLLMDFHRCW